MVDSNVLSSRLSSAIRDFCLQHGLDKTYCVAYSGGLDSHVLLSLLHSIRQEFSLRIRAIHVNHGLSPQAKAWDAHCNAVCQQYQIDYQSYELNLALSSGDSLEEVARNKRYDIFANALTEQDILLTAHHQDDQAETLLLQLLRGAGVKGLASMPMMKAFAKSQHGRPLLTFSRAELNQYANDQQLHWIDDESNANTKLTRNFIRHDVLPLLEKRGINVKATLSRTANHAAEAQTLLNEYGSSLCKEVIGSVADTISVSKLSALSAAQQRLVLRTWLQQYVTRLPDTKNLETIQLTFLNAAQDRFPSIHIDNKILHRYRDDLYLEDELFEIKDSYHWDLKVPLVIPHIGTLSIEALPNDFSFTEGLTVRFRQDGEIVMMPGRGKRALKRLFQEWGVPSWRRHQIPLLYREGQLVGVVGYFLNREFFGADLKITVKSTVIPA